MVPLTNILVATDFSAPSARAVDRAARLAHDHRATLYLVHVPAHCRTAALPHCTLQPYGAVLVMQTSKRP